MILPSEEKKAKFEMVVSLYFSVRVFAQIQFEEISEPKFKTQFINDWYLPLFFSLLRCFPSLPWLRTS